MTTPQVVAIIPAAGIGSRMQADRPKQYLPLLGKTILEHTVELLLSHDAIDYAVIAISPDDNYFHNLSLAHHPRIKVVEGGDERANSVLNALTTLDESSWALVHDAARPCVNKQDISALLNVISNDKVTGGILATQVRDTMKRGMSTTAIANTIHAAEISAPPLVAHTESRVNLWHALTPQLFPTRLLKQALISALKNGEEITDEASAMELNGYRVALIDSNPANIKITHPGDLPLANFYLQQQKASVICE